VRPSGASAVLAALAVAVAVAALNVMPVESQSLRLEALEASAAVPLDDPWDAVWDGAPSQEVPLSAQAIAPPFGGGTIEALTARALHDGQRLYILLEWADDEVDDAVNGFEEFSDAAAVQFPAASADSLPPFTMGGRGAPVNIWQWKAVWQADIEGGFATSQTRYPNTYVDEYPNADDPLYKPAAHVGNPLAQREHDSAVENLIAEGFGTLTNADVQDIDGSGEWREGRWRALFARALEPADESQAGFEVGLASNVAFAVWDGSSGERDGVKSIAQFIELAVGEGAAPAAGAEDGDGFGGAQVVIVVVIALAALAATAAVFIAQRQRERAG
jgi:complex iron-sulfur molybdoenzyme family reductase subunit gamma